MNPLKTQLLKFNEDLVEIGSPISDDRIENFELKIGYQLPPIFKSTLKDMNAFSIYGSEVYGFGATIDACLLYSIYRFEHEEVGNPMPANIFPFSPDGGGNHYCLNLSSSHPDQVLFWVHDLDFDHPEQLDYCNTNILEWGMEIIDSILEEYDYDGNEK